MTDRTEPEPRAGRRAKSPVQVIIDNLDGEFYTVSQAAEKVGVSPNTLRNWYRNPNKNMTAPSKQVKAGKMTIYLYTPEDIKELQAHKNTAYENGEES